MTSINISNEIGQAIPEKDSELQIQKLKLPPYSGDHEGWYLWRRLVDMTFKQYNLLPLLNNQACAHDHPHSNKAVYGLLYISVSSSSTSATIDDIDDTNGYGAWNALCTRHVDNGGAELTIQRLEKQFVELTLDSSITPATYIAKFRTYVKTMKDIGGGGVIIPESILIEKFLAKVEDETYGGLINIIRQDKKICYNHAMQIF